MFGEWRDLRKEKPKKGEIVLCYQPKFKKIGESVIDIGVYENGVIHIKLASQTYDDARYWMPLPKIPLKKGRK